ncbi:hypothetical protein ACFL6C_00855 [Myxococcota bacterium]
MDCVLEYGENIGTLRNLFREPQDAAKFAKKIMDQSDEEYVQVAPNKWHCPAKDEYVEVKQMPPQGSGDDVYDGVPDKKPFAT